MSHGWIKLHRSMIDWEWYTDQNTSRLFIHCLIRANHSDKKWRGNNIKRGQFITSLDTLSCETGLTVSQVRTALKKLDDTNEIASLSQARSRVITVVKYDQYQADDRLDDKLIAGSSQADRRLIATDKNVKNDKNEKECNKKERAPVVAWVAPQNLNLEAWAEFEQHRKSIRKPLSDIARTKAAKSIINLSQEDQQTTIDRSIQSGWAGLFPESSKQQDNRPFFQKNNDSVREQLFGKKKGETYEH